MTVQAWLIFTPAQRDEVLALNDDPDAVGQVIPRVIDNPMADQQGYGEMVGDSVAPARLLNDPEYTVFYDLCSTLTIRTMDSEVLFLPIIDDG